MRPLRPDGTNLRPDGTNLRPDGTNLRPDGNTLNHIAGCLLSFLVACTVFYLSLAVFLIYIALLVTCSHCTVSYLMSETQANSGKAAHFLRPDCAPTGKNCTPTGKNCAPTDVHNMSIGCPRFNVRLTLVTHTECELL